jgi:uncharacterized protein (TIGR02996 family)
MSPEHVFLREIFDSPDDDTPRLVYADWLDEHGGAEGAARAELIRLQCRVAQLPEDDDVRPSLERRCRLLLREHRDRWLGPLQGQIHDAALVRGFVERVEADLDMFAAHGEEWLRQFPVRHVILVRVGIGDDADLEQVATMPCTRRLTTLEMRPLPTAVVPTTEYPPLSETAARALARSPHLEALRRLVLSDFRLTPAAVETLARAPHLHGLEGLVLARNQLTLGTLAALADYRAFPGLVELDLANNHPGEDLFPLLGLADRPRLRHVRLAYDLIHDGFLVGLAGSALLERLESLDLGRRWGGMQMGRGLGRGLDALAAAPALASLRELSLAGPDVISTSQLALVRSPHLVGLELLNLSHIDPGPAFVAGLADSPALSGLRTLRLRGNTLRQRGLDALTQGRPLRRLRRLDLGENDLDATGAALLADWPGSDGLTALYLDGNNLGAEGARQLADSPRLARLRLLDLAGNSIGPDGACALADSHHLTRLTELRLNWNNLDDEGVIVLARSAALHHLAALHLHGNRVGDAGARALATSPHLEALERLVVISGNRIGPRGRRALLDRFGEHALRP